MKWLKQKLDAFWEWMYSGPDFYSTFGQGDARARGGACGFILALLIIPFIFFIIWLDSLFK